MLSRKIALVIAAIICFGIAVFWVLLDGANAKVYPVCVALGLALFAGAFV